VWVCVGVCGGVWGGVGRCGEVCLGGRDPLLRVLLKEREDEIHALRGDVVPLGAREGHLRSIDEMNSN